MLRKITSGLVLTLLLATIFSAFSIRSAKTESGVGEATIYVSPQLSNFTAPPTAIGDSFTVTVRISNYSHVAAWQVKLVYDNQLLGTSANNTVYATDYIFPSGTYATIPADAGNYNETHNYVIITSTAYGAAEYDGSDAGLVAARFYIRKISAEGEAQPLTSLLWLEPIGTWTIDTELNENTEHLVDGYYQISGSGGGTIAIPPSTVLLEGGTEWAAGTGRHALYIDWYDNWLAHHETDGANWGPWPEEKDMINWSFSVTYVLNKSGFDVALAGDIPEDLSGYDVVVIHSYWAVEPRHAPLIRDYIANGGGVVLLSGVPEYFRCYCKDWWTYRCPTANESLDMSEWFGTGYYVNTGGSAQVTIDNPFNTSLLAGDTVISGCGGSGAAIVDGNIGVVAEWEDGFVFAFTRAYGEGRLYYQAAFECLDPPAPSGLKADITGDLKVDGKDIAIVARSFNTRPGAPLWNAVADLDGNLCVDGKDVAIVAKYYNFRYP